MVSCTCDGIVVIGLSLIATVLPTESLPRENGVMVLLITLVSSCCYLPTGLIVMVVTLCRNVVKVDVLVTTMRETVLVNIVIVAPSLVQLSVVAVAVGIVAATSSSMTTEEALCC